MRGQRRRGTAELLTALLTLGVCTPSPPPGAAHSPTTTTAATGAASSVVSSALDRGPGSLRRALSSAEAGDVITFDQMIFPPDAPAVIAVESELPHLSQGSVTVDGSNAGVILDGGQLPGEGFVSGLGIDSDGNTIMGLQIVNFPGPGIGVGGGDGNTIGGDRAMGAGPIGQGNLTGDNGNGIALWGPASGNVVTGNLIGTGTDGSELLGNRAHGVWITEGAERNVLGPDNVVAHNGQAGVALQDGARDNVVGPRNVIASNGESGVWVDGPRSFGNTITGNSIHDHAAVGIYVSGSGNAGLIAPAVLDLDMGAGTVVGTACPGCAVEIFSDADDEGGTFEGSATADGAGVFALDAGHGLAGPHLTAVAIDAEGNSSEFSPPTSGTIRTAVMQVGNNRPRTTISIQTSPGPPRSGIGDMWNVDPADVTCPSAFGNSLVHRTLRYGYSWVRLSLDPREWWGGDVGEPERYDGPFSSFRIDPCQDRIISALARRGVTIVLTIVFWDERFHAERPPDYGNDEEVRGYLAYVRHLARHFADRVRYFEILNEAVFYVDLPDYLDLVRRAVSIIRREAAEAGIVAGGAANLLDPGSREYLFGLLRSDVVHLIDAVELHPMYGASPQYDDTRRYYDAFPSLVNRVRKVARAHGFSGRLVAEEMLWRTPLNAGAGQPWVYTPIMASKYLLRTIVMHRGLGVWAGIDTPTDNLDLRGASTIPSFVPTAPRLTSVMDGARPTRLHVRIETEATDVTSYGFGLPNGDRLLAVWRDGVASDDDPGIPATITIAGERAERAIGIDVLNGFQEELITVTGATTLVIDGLLIEDYPVFIRLTTSG